MIRKLGWIVLILGSIYLLSGIAQGGTKNPPQPTKKVYFANFTDLWAFLTITKDERTHAIILLAPRHYPTPKGKQSLSVKILGLEYGYYIISTVVFEGNDSLKFMISHEDLGITKDSEDPIYMALEYPAQEETIINK